jgi:nucleoside-diphosphate-sugar epimerase
MERCLLREDLEYIVQRSTESLEELRSQSLFLTGGTGFFGSWLLETLCHANDFLGLQLSVTVLSRSPGLFLSKHPQIGVRNDISWIEGDVRSFRFPKRDFSCIIHAGTSANKEVKPLEMLKTIVFGTSRVLDFSRVCGASKLIYVSSGAVYGPQPDNVKALTEDFCGAPTQLSSDSAYGEGKRLAELECYLHGNEENIQVKIARCFAFYGPRLPLEKHFAIGNFIAAAMSGRPIVVNGTGKALRTYMYAADLIVWLLKILCSGVSGRAYNVGGSAPIAISKLAEVVAGYFGGIEVIYGCKDLNRVDPSYVPDCSRCHSELNLSEGINLLDGLDKTYRWLTRTAV